MDFITLRIVSVIVIAFIYMIFDIFNKRNVPELFAYGTLAYGALLTIITFNEHIILISVGIALVVSGLGYVVYKIGQIGAADVIEFAAISLIIPIALSPLLVIKNQIGIPFIISVFVSTGVAAMAMVAVYYLPKAIIRSKRGMLRPTTGEIFKALTIAVVYTAFILFLAINSLVSHFGVVLLLLITILSIIIILFGRDITGTMIEYVGVNNFDVGDIIAFNLMKRSEISAIKRKIRSFDKLVTAKLIDEMKKNRVSKRFPVYKKAIPLATAIFVGVVVSLLIGNIIILAL